LFGAHGWVNPHSATLRELTYGRASRKHPPAQKFGECACLIVYALNRWRECCIGESGFYGCAECLRGRRGQNKKRCNGMLVMFNARKRILCLEDNLDIQSLIKLVLRHAPTDVVTAESVGRAWDCIDAYRPDLILLDMMLPGVNGLEFLEDLRSDGRYATVPVIVLSIRADMSFRRRAQELGIFRYLLKPFSPSVLRSEVEQALGVDWQRFWTRPKCE
jgi:CheY-like chemotaxis protein